MSKHFSAIISFKVDGDIYDNKTKPDSIIEGYSWSFEENCDGNIQIFGHHKDNRGNITNITKMQGVKKYREQPIEYL